MDFSASRQLTDAAPDVKIAGKAGDKQAAPKKQITRKAAALPVIKSMGLPRRISDRGLGHPGIHRGCC